MPISHAAASARARKGWETRRKNGKTPIKKHKSYRSMTEAELREAERHLPYNRSVPSKLRDEIEAERKRRQQAKYIKEDRERAKKARDTERERKLHVRGQSDHAKAPVRKALKNAEAAREHYWTVVTMKQRGKATWDDVRDAETAHRLAQEKHSAALHAYYEKYHQHYVN